MPTFIHKLFFSFLLTIIFLICILQYGIAQKDTLSAKKMYLAGIQLFENADYQKAITQLEQASTIYQNANHWEMALTCQNMQVMCMMRQGQIEKALEQSLLIQNNIARLPKNSMQETDLYNILGEIYLNKGRTDIALENLLKALQLYESFHSKQKKQIANCLNTLGLVHWNKGNNDMALEFLMKSLALRQEIYAANHQEIAASLNDIGLVYSNTDFEIAREYYEKALQIYIKIFGENHPKTATAYNNIAITYRKAEEYEKAIENFEKVLAIWQTVFKDNHPNIAFVFANLGAVSLDKKDFLAAYEYQKKALNIYQKNYGNKHPEIANTYNSIGTIFLRQKKYKLALENYQNALIANVSSFSESDIRINPDGKDFYNIDILLSSLLLKAQALEEQHFNKTVKVRDLELALKTLQQCDELIESIRQLRVKKSDKIALGLVASEVYEDGIRVCLALAEGAIHKNNYFEQAFYFAEKSKSAVLLEAISDTDAKQFANIPDDLLEKERQLKSEIAFYELKLAEKPDVSLEKQYRDKLFSLNQQYNSFIKDLENKFPDYFNLKYNFQLAKIENIQQQLDDETLMMSYFLAEKTQRLYVFNLSSKNFWVNDVPQIEKLKKYLIGLRNGIKFTSLELFKESASELFFQLFPEKLPKKIKKLIIIPEGSLGKIPFEALLTEKIKKIGQDYRYLPYLIQQYEICYHYSANLFYQNQKKSANKAPLDICFFAPVEFNHPNLTTLPATENEVLMIQHLFKEKSKQSQCYIRKNASEKAIKKEDLKNYSIIHCSTHGIVNEDNPELSQIFLGNEGEEDGNLYSGEIYNLQFNADLVILSACETGLGKVSKGEGIIGLSRALLYAGAKNLIVSFWSVADESTSQLMIDFYKNLLNSDKIGNFVVALREAKIKMIDKQAYAQPYFWAPFILIGN